MKNGLKSDGTIESKGSQLFNVPATDEGKTFLKLARKFLNRSRFKGLHARGRGKRVHDGKHYDDSLPQNLADWYALYIKGIELPPWASQQMDEYRKEIETLRKERVGEIEMEKGISTVVMIGETAVRVEGATGIYIDDISVIHDALNGSK